MLRKVRFADAQELAKTLRMKENVHRAKQMWRGYRTEMSASKTNSFERGSVADVFADSRQQLVRKMIHLVLYWSDVLTSTDYVEPLRWLNWTCSPKSKWRFQGIQLVEEVFVVSVELQVMLTRCQFMLMAMSLRLWNQHHVTRLKRRVDFAGVVRPPSRQGETTPGVVSSTRGLLTVNVTLRIVSTSLRKSYSSMGRMGIHWLIQSVPHIEGKRTSAA